MLIGDFVLPCTGSEFRANFTLPPARAEIRVIIEPVLIQFDIMQSFFCVRIPISDNQLRKQCENEFFFDVNQQRM